MRSYILPTPTSTPEKEKGVYVGSSKLGVGFGALERMNIARLVCVLTMMAFLFVGGDGGGGEIFPPPQQDILPYKVNVGICIFYFLFFGRVLEQIVD